MLSIILLNRLRKGKLVMIRYGKRLGMDQKLIVMQQSCLGFFPVSAISVLIFLEVEMLKLVVLC